MANGWIALEELIEHYDLDGVRTASFGAAETIVAPPFYELAGALCLLEDGAKWTQLVAASKDHDLQMKAGAIEATLQERFEAILGG